MTDDHLIIRTDASAQIGSGHAMRCLALAQAAKEYGIRTTFVMNECAETVATKIKAESFDIQTHMPKGNHIVVDGYQFDSNMQEKMRSEGRRVLFIDDFGHCERYVSDLVLNQNIYANESFYQHHSPETKLLLGPKYVLLRKEFQHSLPHGGYSPLRGEIKRGGMDRGSTKILITVGGFDQRNFLDRMENALKNMDCDVRIAKNAINMPELMQWADLAITAAGTTVYELAYMGVPTAMIVLAENQKRVAEGMEDAGYGINLGWHEDVSDSAMREAVIKLIPKIKTIPAVIDPYGTHRVLSEFLEWPFWLRPATHEDCKLLFDWANDPVVRTMSFSTKPIHWDEHQDWFEKKLHDSSSMIFIGIDREENPIGQIRFDIEGNAAEVGINLAPKNRGKGLGSALIDMGVRRLLATTTVREICAAIKKENTASLRAFEKAGFTPTTTGTLCPPATCRLLRRRADLRI